jgi:poly-gamma-glutamate biosynthesis protein PgsC/CapC
MLTNAIGIGILINFIFIEMIGFSSGGLIVPGYIAFFWEDPYRIVITFIISLITYGLINLLSKFLIIYSKRRFMLSVIIGYLLGYVLNTSLINYIPFNQDLRVIGFIIPGLIANSMIRQGIISTIISTLSVSIIVRLILLLIMF